MGAPTELVEKPLGRDALAARYRTLCADAQFQNLQGKLELDHWGRIIVSPASNFHGILQMRLGVAMRALGGTAIAEASVVTGAGLLVVDVAWASSTFMAAHGRESPFMVAPELCVEIASPSNSRQELEGKMVAYIDSGATEAWIVLPQSRRIECFDRNGKLDGSNFSMDLSGLFD